MSQNLVSNFQIFASAHIVRQPPDKINADNRRYPRTLKGSEMMRRAELLAAEVYGYSYQHYQEKLEMGHPRFKKIMPETISILEKAEKENWAEKKLSKTLDIPSEHLPGLLDNFRQAIDIVDAANPAESFRRSVKHSIINALSEGLNSEKEIEALAVQICYRTADLGYLIDLRGKQLTDYSKALRLEPDIERL